MYSNVKNRLQDSITEWNNWIVFCFSLFFRKKMETTPLYKTARKKSKLNRFWLWPMSF